MAGSTRRKDDFVSSTVTEAEEYDVAGRRATLFKEGASPAKSNGAP